MRKLIVVVFFTPTLRVLLKTKEINGRKLFVLLDAWQKRGESNIGTLKRIVKEIESLAPPQTFRLRFTKLRELEMRTKFGKVKKVYYVCYLPFEPILEIESGIVSVEREGLAEFKKEIPKEDYSIILETLAIQKSLIDFL